MTDTSYTIWDKHNNLAFVLDGNTAFSPGVLLTQSNVTSGSVLTLLSTKGLFSEAGGSSVSGLNMPGGARIIGIAGSTITLNAPVLGPVPPFTPLTFRNPVHLAIKGRDPKNLGKYYVEFLINSLGVGPLTSEVGVGLSQFGSLSLSLADRAPQAAIYYSEHKVYVNEVPTSVGVLSADTSIDTPSGNILSFGVQVDGITEGDAVSGFNIAPNTVVVLVDTDPLSPSFGQVTLNNNITGDVPANTAITFTEIWSDGCIIAMAVDLDDKFIQFRKIGGETGAIGKWSSLIDISSLDIDPSTLARGAVLVAVNGTGNGGLSISLQSDPADFNGRIGPPGYTLGWPDNKFSDDLGVVKSTAYIHSEPPNLAVRKATSASLSSPPNEALRKVTSYSMSGPPGLAVRKLTAVLFLFQIPTPWYPMTTPPLYPELIGLTYTVTKTPMWSTGVSRAGSGRTIRVGYYAVNLWQFELKYDFLPDGGLWNGTSPNDLKALEGFFISPGVTGGLGGFRINDPDDNAAVAEVQGTTDGISTNWLIGRKFSHAGGNLQVDSVFEPVGYVNVGQPVNVYLDNVLQDPSTYDIVTTTPVQQQLHFHTAPIGGKTITMDFSFWFFCRFQEDKLDFIKFMQKLWQQDKIVLESLRG